MVCVLDPVLDKVPGSQHESNRLDRDHFHSQSCSIVFNRLFIYQNL